MKVYMVHRESGEYSDWVYRVEGIFSTYDKAREYLEAKSQFFWLNEYSNPLSKGCRWRPFQSKTDEPCVKVGLVTSDGFSFSYPYKYPFGKKSYFVVGVDEEYFITEYELDEPSL